MGVVVLASALAALGLGCGSKSEDKAVASASAEALGQKETPAADVEEIPEGQVLTQQIGDTNVSWLVKPSGDVYALVKKNGKEVPASALDGKVTVAPLGEGGAPVEKKLTNEGGVLTTNVGPLAGTVNEVKYDLVVDKQPVVGVLHVPKTGTDALIDEAKVAAKAKFKPGTLGPHKGVVQVVDEDVVEIVGQTGGGAIRVYYLDDDLKEIKAPDHKVKLALYAGKTYWVELKPHESGTYFYADVDIKVDPTMITVVIEDKGDVDVCLVDYVPGHVVVWGPSAPVIHVWVVASWDVFVIGGPDIHVHPGKHKKKHKKWKH